MEELFDKIRLMTKKYPDIYKIILFGSRARGDFRENSDIDLAIFSTDSSNLVVANFIDDIENLSTLYKFDIIFIDSNVNEKLIDSIKKDGVVIMERLSNKVQNLVKAVNRLEEALIELRLSDSSVVRDGVIQRFEFTTELAWKAAREYLIDQGFVDLNSPKAVMKEAFSSGLIADAENWVEILSDRNLTSHIYQEELAVEISNRIRDTHFSQLQALAEKLGIN